MNLSNFFRFTPYSRLSIFLLVVMIWAGIFLPELGTPELKGEEARRILPALTMLESGNWLVPMIGGEEYFNKPPLINWLIAAAFLLTGEHSEWAARLPSVGFILLFVSLLIWMPSPFLTLPARLIAAIIFLTNLGMLEKGRMIEIEAVYVSLTGLAILWWLNSWSANAHRWIIWLPTFGLLGLGVLLKGPVGLIVFYIILLAVLLQTGRWRELFGWGHITGSLLMCVVFAAWALPAFMHSSGSTMGTRWVAEIMLRFSSESGQINYGEWMSAPFKALRNFLPWALLLPLLWNQTVLQRIPQTFLPMLLGARNGMVVGFILISLPPGTLARYYMPLFPIALILLGYVLSIYALPPKLEKIWRGMFFALCFLLLGVGIIGLFQLTHSILAWLAVIAVLGTLVASIWRWQALVGNVRLSVATAWFFLLLSFHYAIFGMVVHTRNYKWKTTGYALNQLVPKEEVIYIYRIADLPFRTTLYYLRPPMGYVNQPQALTDKVRYLLLNAQQQQQLMESTQFAGRTPQVLYKVTHRIAGDYRLLYLAP